MFIGMISDAELSRSRVWKPHLNVSVLVVGRHQVGRAWSEAYAMRRGPAKGLPAHELPFAALHVYPVDPQTVCMSIGGGKHIGRVVAVEVHLGVTGHIVQAVFPVYLKAESRILPGGAELRDMCLGQVAERDV